MSTSHISNKIREEIHQLETEIYKLEGEVFTTKEDLDDLRRAYKAMLGVECNSVFDEKE